MPTNFQQFVAEVDAQGPKQLAKDFDLNMRRMGLALLRGIIFGSPVGNPALWQSPAPAGYVGGSFRAAWVVTLGRPSEEIRDRVDSAGTAVIAEGSRVVAGYRGFSSIWLSNNLPYAARIEDGHSTQAPTGVVKVNLARVAVRFRRTV